MKKSIINLGIIVCILTSCSKQPSANTPTSQSDQSTNIASPHEASSSPINVIQAAAVGDARLTSKGVITSEHDVPVFSLVSSVIKKINVHEGQLVHKGQLLASLDDAELSNQVRLAQSQLDQAEFQYQSILVGQGYESDKLNQAPEHIKKAARVRSSIDLNENQLNNAKTHLAYCQIKAPISGLITDVKVVQFNLAQEGQPLFHIIDPDHLNINFTILESELKHFSIGKVVTVTPIAYADEPHKATVIAISPKVDENGMIKIKARLTDNAHLLVGMNAIVTL